ncbi:MAG: GTPase HflX [Chromatiaceae bacterium]|nr:MAG: GTPase HflX [Chromatiaceae bacterium]
MFERPRAGERAILVQVAIGQPLEPDAAAEFRLLAKAAGAITLAEITAARHAPEPRLFIGSGKAAELRDAVVATAAELVIFNQPLSPAQERNLERHLQCRVVDRNGLILDIFAQRARSFEGKLQVELAQLRHLSTRLVRGWTHLERQKGGIGLRGPGETQLETDRRLLGKRITQLNERLARIEAQRTQGRRARARAEVPTLSLVGYTNAGKSTLFNRLTAAGVFQADQLFATLDPTLRRLPLPEAPAVVLADTVGFINQLPHELVAAFRSTLQETRSAQLLLHVVDAAAEQRDRRIADVDAVLTEIGVDKLPRLLVYNKIDQLPGQSARLDRNADGQIERVWLSAADGTGIDLLLAALAEIFRGTLVQRRLVLGPGEGGLRSWLYGNARVLTEAATEQGGWELLVEVSDAQAARHLDARTDAPRPAVDVGERPGFSQDAEAGTDVETGPARPSGTPGDSAAQPDPGAARLNTGVQ